MAKKDKERKTKKDRGEETKKDKEGRGRTGKDRERQRALPVETFPSGAKGRTREKFQRRANKKKEQRKRERQGKTNKGGAPEQFSTAGGA